MPTKTFMNLNETKQELVFNALLSEFSEHKLLDAQVARIIKNCDIARGSFYKYFDDITDSYNYVLRRVLDAVHFDVFKMIKNEHQNTLDSFYQSTVDFIAQINQSRYRDFYRMHVAYNQYNLKSLPFDYHSMSMDRLVMIVNGNLIDDANVVAVVYKAATAASHNAIRSILIGADEQVELADLKTMLMIINQGLLEGMH